MERINDSNDTKQYVVFRLGQEEYGVDIQYVQIIERIMGITRVPKSQYFIKGVINLRGEIVPVMSLRARFELAADEYTEDSRIIIIRLEDSSIGMIVDEVKEVLQLSNESIENVQGTTSDIDMNYILGVGKIEGRIVTLLNIKQFVGDLTDKK